jgi:hypothetical protein
MIPQKYYVLVFVLVLMYLWIFEIAPHVTWGPYRRVVQACWVKCPNDTCEALTAASRGNNYYLDNSKYEECGFTFWEGTHLLFHVVLGYFFPLWVSMGLSFGFEILEYKMFACGSWFDLLWNFTGAAIGTGLRAI